MVFDTGTNKLDCEHFTRHYRFSGLVLKISGDPTPKYTSNSESNVHRHVVKPELSLSVGSIGRYQTLPNPT
jgi:hypothetical protein